MPSNDLSVKITTDTVELVKAEKELGKFQKSFTSLNAAMEKNYTSWGKVTSVVTAASTAFTAINTAVTQYVIAPLKQAVTAFMDFGDSISKTSQRVGIGVESLGALKFAAEQCGANFQILTEGIKSFQNQLGAANMGDAAAIGKLGKAGLSAGDFAGLPEEEQLMKLADHIAAIGDKSEQTSVAIELFGKSGFKLLPFLQEGSAGIKKLMAEGKEIGAVLGEDAVTGAVNLTDAMNRLKTSSKAIGMQIMGSLAPALTSMLDTGTKIFSAIGKFYNSHKRVINAIGAGVGTMLAFVSAMSAWAALLPVLTAGVGSLSTAFAWLNTMLLANPFGLAIAGAVALGAAMAALGTYFTVTTDKVKALDRESAKAIKDVDKAVADLNKTLEDGKKRMDELNAQSEKTKELLDRLEELSAKEGLNNREKQEQVDLLNQLIKKYPQLGECIDKNTGKMKDFNATMVKAIDAEFDQKEQALSDQARQLEASAKNSEQLRDKIFGEQLWDFHNDKEHRGDYSSYIYTLQRDDVSNSEKRAAIKDLWKGNAENRQFAKLAEAGIKADETARKARTERDSLDYTSDTLGLERNLAKERFHTGRLNARADQIEEFDKKVERDAMTPFERRRADLDAEYKSQMKALKEAESEALALSELDSFLPEDQESYRKKAEGYKKKQKRLKKWKRAQDEQITDEEIAALPDEDEERRDFLIPKNEELEKAEQAVIAAREKQAQAILKNEGVQEADDALAQAQEDLARTVAQVSGQARQSAKEKLDKAIERLHKAEQDPTTSNAELNNLMEQIREYEKMYHDESEKYFAATGQLRKDADEQPTEEKVQEAVQTTLGSAGTFSAYGMDAAIVSDIPQQQLDVLRKLLDNTDEIKEEQKNEGTYTK